MKYSIVPDRSPRSFTKEWLSIVGGESDRGMSAHSCMTLIIPFFSGGAQVVKAGEIGGRKSEVRKFS